MLFLKIKKSILHFTFLSCLLFLFSCANNENFNPQSFNDLTETPNQTPDFQSTTNMHSILYGTAVTDERLKAAIVGINHCTGSYLGNGIVITAAHCQTEFTTQPISFNLKTGIITCPIVDAIIHDKYNPSNSFNDIALVKFKCSDENQKLISKIKPFTLDNGKINKNDGYYLAGYGFNEDSTELNFPDLRFYKDEHTVLVADVFDIIEKELNLSAKERMRQQSVYQPLENENLSLIFKVENNKSVHVGDSGGPVYFFDSANNFYLTGVISFMLMQGLPEHIHTSKIFAHFSVKVEAYLKWIELNKTALLNR